jgi:hypothetical protein
MRRNMGIIGVAAAMAMGLAVGPGVDLVSQSPEPAPRRRARRIRKGNYDPQINRWTGKPHEHKREIARRLRQARGS